MRSINFEIFYATLGFIIVLRLEVPISAKRVKSSISKAERITELCPIFLKNVIYEFVLNAISPIAFRL